MLLMSKTKRAAGDVHRMTRGWKWSQRSEQDVLSNTVGRTTYVDHNGRNKDDLYGPSELTRTTYGP